jgi:glycosyltransferase involved in cell wall biosynthesis
MVDTQTLPTAAETGGSPTELTVLLPCLNEAETIGCCVDKAHRAMDQLGVTGEIIVADNGSTDGSPQIAARLGARVVDVPTPGYGAALRAGIAAASSEYVIIADADDSYDLSDLEPFLRELRQGSDLVMGNRFAGGIEPGAMPRLHRYLGNPVLSFLGRLFFHSPSRDFHCGMRGFQRSKVEALQLRTTGMEFASEMVVKATLAQLVITEVPTTLSRDGRTRPPHLNTWRDGWRHLRFLLLYSPRWLFLYPGLVLMAAGLALGGALLVGPVKVGGIGLDVNALLYCMVAVLVGFQSVLFAMLARAFAMNEALLPRSSSVDRAFRIVTLERGLLVGALLLLVGFGISVYSLVHWGSAGFGALDARTGIRLVVPGATATVLGFEVVLASLFFSLLGLARK